MFPEIANFFSHHENKLMLAPIAWALLLFGDEVFGDTQGTNKEAESTFFICQIPEHSRTRLFLIKF